MLITYVYLISNALHSAMNYELTPSFFLFDKLLPQSSTAAASFAFVSGIKINKYIYFFHI